MKRFSEIFNDFYGPSRFHFSYSEDLKARYTKDENSNCVVEVPVPGFNKDNLEIKLNKNYIEIKGETKTRTLYKNVFIDNKVHDIKASVKDGILSLTIIYKDNEETKKIPID